MLEKGIKGSRLFGTKTRLIDQEHDQQGIFHRLNESLTLLNCKFITEKDCEINLWEYLTLHLRLVYGTQTNAPTTHNSV